MISNGREGAATGSEAETSEGAESTRGAETGSDTPRGSGRFELDWKLASQVAKRLAAMPNSGSFEDPTLESDFEAATKKAERLVADHTGLRPPNPARAKVVDRHAWIDTNIEIFREHLGPLIERIPDTRAAPPLPIYGTILSDVASALIGTFRLLARSAASAEVGVLLGFLSRRVLGQYDSLLPGERGDVVYYVGPNVVVIERQYDLSPNDFRLWIALHECTHRAQFTAVPWLPEYFANLVSSVANGFQVDLKALAESLRRAAEAVLRGQDPFAELGVAGVFATGEQRQSLRKLQALMCLLEGHGETVMDEVGRRVIPSGERLARILETRRATNGLQRLVFRILGVETKIRQYQLGASFVKSVLEEGGNEALALAWRSPEDLPTLEEIENPSSWLARVAA